MIATRIPGCVDAVRDGETGLLVPVRDTEALTAAIRMYLRDPTLRQQHGANARHRALCEFGPRIMREALLQEYVRLLGERGCDELGGHLDWGRRPHAGGIRGDRWLDDYESTNEQDLSRNNPAR